MGNHVVLLRRDASLAIALRARLGTDQVPGLGTAEDWASLPEERVDAVVADVPPRRRLHEVEEIRARYNGPLVLVLDHGDDPAAVPPEHHCSVIKRPFEVVALWQLVTDAADTPAAEAAGPRRLAPAPAKPSPAGEPGPRAAIPVRDLQDLAERDRAERERAAPDQAEDDSAAAQASWTWRGRRFRPRPTAPEEPATEVPPTPPPPATRPAAAEPKARPGARAPVPPSREGRPGPAGPPVTEARPAAAVPKSPPAAEAKEPP